MHSSMEDHIFYIYTYEMSLTKEKTDKKISTTDVLRLAHAVVRFVLRTPFANGTTWNVCNSVNVQRDLLVTV